MSIRRQECKTQELGLSFDLIGAVYRGSSAAIDLSSSPARFISTEPRLSRERGSAFGAFNAAYGVPWFLGSVTMGVLYDYSRLGLVAFGVAAQPIAAILFIRLRRALAPQRGASVVRKTLRPLRRSETGPTQVPSPPLCDKVWFLTIQCR
jgi:MFS family permease